MNSKMKYWTSVIKNIALFLTTLIFIYALLKLSIFYIPFLIGFIISQIIEPMIKNLSNTTNFTRKTCAVIVLSIIFIITIGFICYGVITLISESSNLLNSLSTYIDKINLLIQKYIVRIKEINLPENVVNIIDKLSTKFLENSTKYVTNILESIIQNVTKIPIIIIYITITILSTYFICADKFYILDQLEHHVPRLWVKKIGVHIKEILSTLGNYFKAEAFLIFISFFIVLGGLVLGKVFGLNIEYPLLSALGIAFVDAMPILGSGTVMIPWAIISVLDGNTSLALVLIGLLIIIVVTKQILEPKLVGSKIGTHPIFTLIAMYTGFKIVGIVGLFIGPIILIILKNIFGQMIDDGLLKSIFNRK